MTVFSFEGQRKRKSLGGRVWVYYYQDQVYIQQVFSIWRLFRLWELGNVIFLNVSVIIYEDDRFLNLKDGQIE